MVKSGKAIYSKLNHIYIPSVIALKMYFLFSVFSLIHTHQYKSFSQSSPSIFSLLFLYVHLDRVRCCAILTVHERKKKG